MGHESRNFRLAHRLRVPPPVKQHELSNPLDIRLLSPGAVTTRPEPHPDTIQDTKAPLARMTHKLLRRHCRKTGGIHPITVTCNAHRLGIPNARPVPIQRVAYTLEEQ